MGEVSDRDSPSCGSSDDGISRHGSSISGVARGGLFLFIGSITVAILGFCYWFFISIFGGTQIVGIASSVYSLGALVSGIATLGVPIGVQRFLGKSFLRKSIESLNTYFWSSLVFVSVLCLLSGIMMWFAAILGIPLTGFSQSMLIWTGVLSCLSFWGVTTALFTSIVKTEYAAISAVVSAIIKLLLGILLVYLGFGWFGAVAGLASESLFLSVLALFLASRELKRLGLVKVSVSFKALGKSVKAGFASWLPGVVSLIGQQLSFLAVFGIQGSFEAGTYYIAYAIFGIIYMLPASFMSVLFPVLSGLADEGGDVVWRVLKLSLGLACPPTAFLLLYSSFPLSLLGGDYVQAAPTLSLLALSTIPLTFISGANNLVYARGFYGRVLGIGLAINVPRVVLYFLLVPIYGGFGAASSFLIGAMTGLGIAIYVSRMANFHVSLGKIAVAVAVPFAAGLPCYLLGLNWLIGGAVILLVSILCYARLDVVERVDLEEIARGFASEKTIARAGQRLGWVLRIIYGE